MLFVFYTEITVALITKSMTSYRAFIQQASHSTRLEKEKKRCFWNYHWAYICKYLLIIACGSGVVLQQTLQTKIFNGALSLCSSILFISKDLTLSMKQASALGSTDDIFKFGAIPFLGLKHHFSTTLGSSQVAGGDLAIYSWPNLNQTYCIGLHANDLNTHSEWAGKFLCHVTRKSTNQKHQWPSLRYDGDHKKKILVKNNLEAVMSHLKWREGKGTGCRRISCNFYFYFFFVL